MPEGVIQMSRTWSCGRWDRTVRSFRGVESFASDLLFQLFNIKMLFGRLVRLWPCGFSVVIILTRSKKIFVGEKVTKASKQHQGRVRFECLTSYCIYYIPCQVIPKILFANMSPQNLDPSCRVKAERLKQVHLFFLGKDPELFRGYLTKGRFPKF